MLEKAKQTKSQCLVSLITLVSLVHLSVFFTGHKHCTEQIQANDSQVDANDSQVDTNDSSLLLKILIDCDNRLMNEKFLEITSKLTHSITLDDHKILPGRASPSHDKLATASSPAYTTVRYMGTFTFCFHIIAAVVAVAVFMYEQYMFWMQTT